MSDPTIEFQEFMRAYTAFMRRRQRRRLVSQQLVIWFERLTNRLLRAFVVVADGFARALVR